MTRFICILIAAYNFKIVIYTWAVFSHYLFNILGIKNDKIGITLIISLVIFMAVHSIKLVMLKYKSVKIQIIISSIHPILHALIILFFLTNVVPYDKLPPNNGIYISRMMFTFLDILVIFYLTRNSTKKSFELAENLREHMQILKQGRNA